MELEMEQITSAAPVQYQGTVNGRPFYFHSRHEDWTFAIADDLDEAIIACKETETIFIVKQDMELDVLMPVTCQSKKLNASSESVQWSIFDFEGRSLVLS